jgi:NADH dehydrogenase [ubiquinone] 1 alpha subcomplex assembly factor 5
MTGPEAIFDRALMRQRRERVAAGFDGHDFLFREIAERLAERAGDVRREFPLALDAGCRTGLFTQAAQAIIPGKIGSFIVSEYAPGMARTARERTGAPTVIADDEALPFAPASFDLVASCAVLQGLNDVPGALLQLRHVLKPDGLFLGALLGGETLSELRHALLAAESEIEGGASPRVAPFAELSDAAGLLQRAGFSLPVADLDPIDVNYDNAFALMHELRGMGESNARLDRRRTPTRRATLLRAAEIYGERFADSGGRIHATFDVFFLTGWAPADSQPQPLRPGSAQARLADALETTERPLDEKTSATFPLRRPPKDRS